MHLSADSLRALHSLIIISNVALWRYLVFFIYVWWYPYPIDLESRTGVNKHVDT